MVTAPPPGSTGRNTSAGPSAGLEDVLTRLAQGGRWDQPPELRFLYRDGSPDGGSRVSERSFVPRWFWGDDPAGALAAVCAHLAADDLALALRPGNLAGLVFICETFLADVLPGTMEASEAAAAALRRELHKLPGRVEARTAVAVTLSGDCWQVSHTRYGGESHVTRDNRGGVPDALRRAASALAAGGAWKE